MKEWTDLDYAQAAIDMLPGSVEEIEEFLTAQRIRNRRSYQPRAWVCPLARWVQKWTGDSTNCVGWGYAHLDDGLVELPQYAVDYIVYADGQVRP